MADQKKNPDQTPLASDSAQRLPLDMDQLGLVAEVKRRIHEAIEDLSSNVSEGDTDAEEAVLKLSSQKSEAPLAMQDPQGLDAFDVITELAGLVDAARTNAREAVEALGQAEVTS